MNNTKISIQDLVESISQSAGTSKKKAEDFLKNFQAIIEEALINDRIVKIKGFGTFKLIWNEARKSVNVQTGEEYIIPGHTKVSFIPDVKVKDSINNPNKASLTNELKKEHDPLAKLNKEAEEIKEIIADIRSMKKPKDEKTADNQPNDNNLEEILPKQEIETPVASIPKTETPVENTGEESIQHSALSEGYVLKERDLPVKPKRKVVKILLPLLLLLFLVGIVLFYFNYKDSLIPQYKTKLVEKVKLITAYFDKTEDVVTEEKTEKPKIESVEVKSKPTKTVADTIAPVKQEKIVKQIEEKPKVSVFDQPRNYSTILATETIEKGSRLVLLAEKYYGHKDFWVYIYEANRAILKTPGSVFVGMKIKIPKLNPALIDLTNPDCLKQAKELEKKYLQQ